MAELGFVIFYPRISLTMGIRSFKKDPYPKRWGEERNALKFPKDVRS
jgi:hypothetical protein